MGKQLNFEYKGKPYCLEFNRTTVRNLESIGFSPNDIPDRMMTRLPQLFEAAFQMHHSGIKPAVVKAIYKDTPNKVELFKCLRAMYSDPYNELLAEPEEDAVGNVTWKANWELEDEDD